MKTAFGLFCFVSAASATTVLDALQDVVGNVAGSILDVLDLRGVGIDRTAPALELCTGRGPEIADPPITPIQTPTYDLFLGRFACPISAGGKTSLSYHYPLYANSSCSPGMGLVVPGRPCDIQYFIYNDATTSVAPVRLTVTGEATAVYFVAFIAPIVDGEFAGRTSITFRINSPVERALQTVQCIAGGITYFTAEHITLIF